MAEASNKGKRGGLPAVVPAPEAYGIVTRNRIRALLDDALAGLTGAKARRDEHGRDLVERIQDTILANPLAALAELEKLLPRDPSAASPSVLNVNALYLAAVQAAQPVAPLALPVIDVEPEPEDW